jgi:hypothetical protein
MVYVAINEKNRKGKDLLLYLKRISVEEKYINFVEEEPELLSAIDEAMKTPRMKAGNSLREII